MIEKFHPYQFLKVVSMLSFAIFAFLGIAANLPVEVIAIRAGIGTSAAVILALAGIKILQLVTDKQRA